MPKKSAAPAVTTSKRRSARADRPADLTVSLPQFLADGSDLKFRELVADLFAAVAGMLALRRALAASVGLSAAEYATLLAAWHLQKKGPVGINTLARQLHIAAANVTSEVGKLVTKGLLDKRPHPRDTRAVLVEVTPRGGAVLSDLTPLLRRINDRLFFGNKAADIAVLSRFMRHIAEEAPHSIRFVKGFTPERDRVPSRKSAVRP